MSKENYGVEIYKYTFLQGRLFRWTQAAVFVGFVSSADFQKVSQNAYVMIL